MVYNDVNEICKNWLQERGSSSLVYSRRDRWPWFIHYILMRAMEVPFQAQKGQNMSKYQIVKIPKRLSCIERFIIDKVHGFLLEINMSYIIICVIESLLTVF